MISPKHPETGRWKKNDGSKPRSHPNVTFNILMAKHKDGKAGFRGHENRTIRFRWIRLVPLRQQARPATNPGHCHDKFQKLTIIINKSIIQRLTSQSGHQFLCHGGLHK
jgi:hypothetical protein